MLVVPLVGQLSWKNPPVITIAIILANIVVFIFFQGNESQYYQEASEYYQSSGLARIEAEAYLNYLKETAQNEKLSTLEKLDPEDSKEIINILDKMYEDKIFIEKLENDQIITPQMKIYGEWQRMRDQVDEILNMSTTQRYGYKPSENRLITTFTAMFLHGSPMHLIGNMVFLWLVGCMIEMSCGRAIYLATYLLTGIISCLFFGLIYSDSSIPLIGASGAISGMMGFYTILFARKKVAVFLSLGFYFTNTRVPALILLPFWIGKEIYQIFLGGPSNVAYAAHLGGLVSGAVFGVCHQKIRGEIIEEVSKEEKEDRLAALMETALTYQADLDFDKARKAFEEVLQEKPGHRKALFQLFQIDKHEPGGKNFHHTADQLLAILARNTASEDSCLTIYREYMTLAKPTRLSVETNLSINRILLKKGLLPEAAAITTFLLKKHTGLPQLPGCLLNLGKAYQHHGAFANSAKCLQLLCKIYPDSPECEAAGSMKRQSS